MSVDNVTQVIADAFYTILTEAPLHQVAPILASISTMLADNSNIYDVADMINKHVGQADDQQTRQLLANLHSHFEQRIYEDEITRLQECFARDREAGWTRWLCTFAQAIYDWRTPLLKMLHETVFPFPEPRVEDVEHIKQWTRYWLIERFEDSYSLPLYLARQSVLSPAQQAKLLVLAAEIQIYRLICFTEGKRQLEEAERKDPQEYTIKRGWGIYWLQQKEYKKAQNSLQEAISLRPQSGDTYIEMGDLYDAQDDFEAAEEWYREAMRRDAGDSNVYTSILRLYGRTEELFKLHEADLPLLRERAITVDPFSSYLAYLATAFVYRTNKRYEDAYSWYKQTISLDETRVDAYIELSYAYTEEKKYQEAYDVLQGALRVAPELFDGYWGMAILHEQQEHWAHAAEWYTRALSYRPEWEGTLRGKIGEMRWHLQEYTVAEDELFKALNIETEELAMQGIVNTLESYAEEYYRTLGKPDAARKIYEEIYRVRGALYEASYQNRLGNLAYFTKNYQEAAEYYRKAIAADPKDPDYPSNLAYALEYLSLASGKTQALDDAHKALQDALKLSPKNSQYAQRYERIELKRQLVKKSGTFILGLSSAPFSIKIELGSTLVQPFFAINGMPPNIQTLVDALRKRFLEHYGLRVPNINFSDNPNLSSGAYAFIISGLPLIRGEVPLGKRFFPGLPHDLIALSIQVDEVENDLLTGMKGCWLAREDWQRVEAANLPLYQEMEYPLRHLEAVLQGINVTLIDHLRTAALLAKEASEAKQQIANTPEKLRWFVQVLRTLASERISFASAMDQLAQAFLEYSETETDLTVIIERLRQLPVLQSTLPGNTIQYSFYRLGSYFEQELTQSLTRVGAPSVLVMESARYENFLNEVTSQIGTQQQVALLVTDAHLRPFARALLDPQLPHMPVLSLNDLSLDLKERAITEIEVPRKNQENGATQDGRSLKVDDLRQEIALSLQDQHNGIERKSIEEDSIAGNLLEIKVFLHPSWYSPLATQENSTDSTQPETQIEQKIYEKLAKLQHEIFREQGVILPIIHFERDENLKIYQIRLHIGTQQELYNETVPIEEWANQAPEELVAEIGILQLVEDLFSIIPSWCKEMGAILLSIDDVQFNLQLLNEYAYSPLVENALQQFSLPMLTRILKEILNAGESIRDLRTILEVLVAIAGTIPIDDRHFPVYPGMTAKDVLKDEKILLFLPRAARYYSTYEGKILKKLNATDYAHYVQIFLQEAPLLKGSGTTVYEELAAYRETLPDYIQKIAHNPAQRLSEKVSEAFRRSSENRIVQRAMAHEELKEYQEALADYTQAITLNPTDTDYYNRRAQLYSTLKEYDRALADYTEMITLNPCNPVFFNSRAYIYFTLEEYEQALADLRQAIELAPSDATFYFGQAVVYEQIKEYDKALANYKEAISLDQSNAYYYYRRGQLYSIRNEYDQTLADYTQAVSLAPSNAEFYYRRAGVLEILNKYEDALHDLERVISLIPSNDDFYRDRERIYGKLKNEHTDNTR